MTAESGLYLVHVQAPGRISMIWSPVAVVEEIELEPVSLAVDVGGIVEVVDPRGAPVAGSRVLAALHSSVGAGALRNRKWVIAPQWITADSAGHASYARDAGSDYFLAALAPGRAEAFELKRREATSRLVLAAAELREVQVFEAGQPVEGAAIWRDAPRLALAVTGVRGFAKLAVPSGGEVAIVSTSATLASGRGRVRTASWEVPTEPHPILLEPPRRIRGRVVDAETIQAIAGALVFDPRGEGVWTRSDQRDYLLEVEQERRPKLVAVARGYVEAEVPFALDAGVHEAPTLALERADSIAGVVVDTDGRAIGSAEVTAAPLPPAAPGRPPGAGQAVDRTRTDHEGRFRLRRLAASSDWIVSVSRAGFGSESVTVGRRRSRQPRAEARIVLPPAGSLTGRVLANDETPIQSAQLDLERSMVGDYRSTAARMRGIRPKNSKVETEEGGRFTFTTLDAGRYDLLVRARGFAPTLIPRIEIGAGRIVQLGEVLLDPGVAVSGRVVDSEGAPVAGAEVWVRAHGVARSRPGAGAPAAISGEDGRFELLDRWPGERVSVVARKGGFGSAGLAEVEVPPAEPLLLQLPALGRVTGRVLDARGEPAAATVSIVSDLRSRGGGLGSVLSSTSFEPVETDADGNFEMRSVPSGELSILARGRQGESAEKRGLELLPGDMLEGVELRFEPGGRLHGRVVDPEGHPARGARVTLEEASGRPVPGAGMVADGEGRFTLPRAPSGRYLAAAELRPHLRVKRPVEIDPLGSVEEIELRLERGLAIRGTVVDDQGRPARDSLVALHPAEGGGRSRIDALTGQGGTFEFEALEPGGYWLVAEKQSYRLATLPEPLVLEAHDIEGVELTLERGGAIFGRLVGLPFDELADVRIVARMGTNQKRTVPDYESAYRIEGLETGEWAIAAEVQRTGRRAQGVVAVADPADEIELDLEFGRGCALMGQVLWRDEPAAAAKVVAYGDDAPLPAIAYADLLGRFRFEGLLEGGYRVRAWDGSGRAWVEERVDLEGDREILLELASARIEGAVRGARDGRPLRGARVRVESLASGPTSGLQVTIGRDGTGPDGLFRIDGVPQGLLYLVVSAEGFAAVRRQVQIVERDQEVLLEFELEPNEGVTLRVVGPNGAPLDRVWAATLDLSGNSMWSGWVVPREGGEIHLSSVPPGDWWLLVGGTELPVVRVRITSPGEVGEVSLPLPGSLLVHAPDLSDQTSSSLILSPEDGWPPYYYPHGSRPRADFPMLGRWGRIANLPPGRWTVTANTAHGQFLIGRATVVANSEVRVELGPPGPGEAPIAAKPPSTGLTEGPPSRSVAVLSSAPLRLRIPDRVRLAGRLEHVPPELAFGIDRALLAAQGGERDVGHLAVPVADQHAGAPRHRGVHGVLGEARGVQGVGGLGGRRADEVAGVEVLDRDRMTLAREVRRRAASSAARRCRPACGCPRRRRRARRRGSSAVRRPRRPRSRRSPASRPCARPGRSRPWSPSSPKGDSETRQKSTRPLPSVALAAR